MDLYLTNRRVFGEDTINGEGWAWSDVRGGNGQGGLRKTLRVPAKGDFDMCNPI